MEHEHHQTARERGERHLREAGYEHKKDGGGDIHEAVRDVHKHERNMHRGKPLTKLRGGGRVHGEEAKHRPDRRARGGHIDIGKEPDDDMGNNVKDARLARGGNVGKRGGKTVINIHAGSGDPQQMQHEQMAKQQGMQQGAQMIAAKLRGAAAGGPPPGAGGPPPGAMPPRPMPPPGAGGPPPGMAGGPPPPGMMPPRARGGRLTEAGEAPERLGPDPTIARSGRPKRMAPVRDEETGRFTGGSV